MPATSPDGWLGHAEAVASRICGPRPCRDIPSRLGAAYRISDNSIQRSVDGGLHWRSVLTTGGHPKQRDGRSCAPARYRTISGMWLDRQLDDALYVATRGAMGNQRKRGCDAAVGGFYVLSNGGPPAAMNAGLPFDRGAAQRTARVYDLVNLSADPPRPTTLLVQARGGHGPRSPKAGLYRSPDGGRSWHAVPTKSTGGRTATPTPRPTVRRTATRTPTARPAAPGIPMAHPTASFTPPPTPTNTPSVTPAPPATPVPTATSIPAPTSIPTNTPTALPTMVGLPSAWAWTPLLANNAPGAPPARQDATVVWDPVDRQLLVYGGTDSSASVAMSDLWAYTPATNSWRQLVAANPAPSGRFGAAGVWDSSGNRLLIFGGQQRTGAGAPFFGDVEAYSPAANTWTTLSTGGGPSPRSRAGAAWDSSANRLLLFGGETSDAPLAVNGELWAFTPSSGTWALLAAGGQNNPPARNWPLLAWDPIAGVLRLLGGKNAANATFSDTWEWSAAGGWLFDEARRQPSGRGAAAGVWDVQHARFLAGPGLGLNGDANDTWAYDSTFTTWTPVDVGNASTPPPRQMTGMGWDDADGEGLLFGGRVSGVGAANDLWALVPTSFILVPTPTSTPSATPTSSLTPSPTPTLTSTPTATPTLTPTFTITPTLTPTVTVTVTPTGTLTVTVTPTGTLTVTATATVTPTATPTLTTSPTPTSTATQTPTFTATSTPTPSATSTSTPTPSATPTNTASPTATPTNSPTPAAVQKAIDVGFVVSDVSGAPWSQVTQQEVNAVKAAGATLVRINFRLPGAADTSWTPQILAAYGTAVSAFESAGIGVLGLVTAGATSDNIQADWQANNNETTGGTGDNNFIHNTYTSALTTLVNSFHGSPYDVKLWELWNEPNVYGTGGCCTGSSYIYPSNFAALLADSYLAIKGGPSPITDVTLISGGIFGHSNGGGAYTSYNAQPGDPPDTDPPNDPEGYLTETYKFGITSSAWQQVQAQLGTYPLDAVGQHIYVDQSGYSTPATIQAYMGWFRAAYTAYEGATTSKQTIVTEAGWSTGGSGLASVSLPQQADNVDALYWAAKDVPYVPTVTWFQLQDNPAGNLFFGLYDPSLNPTKPALAHYQSQ